MNASRPPALPVDLGPGPFVVHTRGVSKRFGPVVALDGLELQLPREAVYVLVGPNGAGKSTLLRILLGLVRRDGGEATVLGVDPATRGPAIRASVGYVPEGHALGYPWMTVGRFLDHQRAYHPRWDDAYARRLAEAWEIDPSRSCGTLSKGQSRRVQLLLALAHRPSLLLLDEPTDGLDHVSRDTTLALLAEHLSDHPTTTLISTHRVHEVEGLVDTVGLLRGGRLLGQMPRSELHGRLLRYWTEVPEDWDEGRPVDARVIRRSRGRREVEWLVWGDRDDVTRRLTAVGAEVRDVGPVTVDEAATALLSPREAP